MSFDQTQHQSTDERLKSEELSLKKTTPPAEVPGYVVQKFLGSGAYGEVWSGLDQNTGRKVAIKFYTRKGGVDVSLLSREVEKLVYLAADRYVVQLLDVGWDANPPHYVMDYIENGSLEDALKRRGTYSASEATELFQEVAIGLMHLHGKGILHCDLKPGNVLLDQDFKPRLADFGQSRLSSEQVSALGTLFYMAPEQADLEAIPDARWDVYALGSLFYTMLTGGPPYRTPEIIQKVESELEMNDRLKKYREVIKSSPPPNQHRTIKGVDRRMAEIIDRCLAVDPNRRYSGAHGVLLALRSREESKARVPFFILGLVGPVLLMLIMSLFGFTIYQRAIDNTNKTLLQEARQTNEFAAQFAARSAGDQIDKYIDAVERLANDPKFVSQFVEFMGDEEIEKRRMKLSDPHRNNDPSLLPERTYVRERNGDLVNTLTQAMNDPRVPKTASWFVCDQSGTQVASVFRTNPGKSTIALNYSFRTYFHGGPVDLKEKDGDKVTYSVTTDDTQRKHIDAPHISAVFSSEATYALKTAFSIPIYIDGQFRGIVATTAEMGRFIDFQNRDLQYVMLIDSRDGKNKGGIVEHPIFDSIRQENSNLPKRFEDYRVDIEEIDNDRFQDPLGKDELGEAYKRDLIAAQAPVTSVFARYKGDKDSPEKKERDEEKRAETGFVVLALEDAENVFAPVQNLESQIGQLALYTILIVCVVIVGIWYMCINTVRESRERLGRAFGGASETHYTEEGETEVL